MAPGNRGAGDVQPRPHVRGGAGARRGPEKLAHQRARGRRAPGHRPVLLHPRGERQGTGAPEPTGHVRVPAQHLLRVPGRGHRPGGARRHRVDGADGAGPCPRGQPPRRRPPARAPVALPARRAVPDPDLRGTDRGGVGRGGASRASRPADRTARPGPGPRGRRPLRGIPTAVAGSGPGTGRLHRQSRPPPGPPGLAGRPADRGGARRKHRTGGVALDGPDVAGRARRAVVAGDAGGAETLR